MANVQHDGSAAEEKSHGAEHTGFLHKLKEKLHIGHRHKEEKAAAAEEAPPSATATEAPASATPTDAPVVTKSSDDHVSATPGAEAVNDVAAPPPATSTAPEDHVQHDVRPTTDVSSLAGHESEHHGGVPTFLAALPDQDIPAEDAPAHPELHHAGGAPHIDSEQAHHGEHHGVVPEGGVPTFLAALPDQAIPAEDAPAHHELHHVPQGGGASHVDSKEAHQGEHQGVVPEGGVPTFLAALPDQDIPAEDAPAHHELHHVQQGGDVPVHHELHHGHHGGGAPHFDSEQVFEQAQQGEHHHGVPTFLVALPDEEIPAEVTKGTSEVTAPEHHEPHHGQHREPHHSQHHEPHHGQHHEPRHGQHHEPHHGHRGEQFGSEQVFQEAQQGEHHHGVPTFMVALPDEEIPAEVTKGVESTPAADDSVTEGSDLLK